MYYYSNGIYYNILCTYHILKLLFFGSIQILGFSLCICNNANICLFIVLIFIVLYILCSLLLLVIWHVWSIISYMHAT